MYLYKNKLIIIIFCVLILYLFNLNILISESINDSLDSMESDVSNIGQKTSLILIKRCSENLKQRVLSITTFYRQPNAKPPTEPSYFVHHIMKPLAIFCNTNKSILSEKRKKEWNAIVADGVAIR
jgi:hypothetical protein